MEPITWVYLALLAASTLASAKGQQKIQHERAKVTAEDTARRKEQQQKGEAAAQRTADEYLNQRNKAAEREAQLQQEYAAPSAAVPTTDATGTRFLSTDAPTQSTRTVQATQDEIAKGQARASQRAISKAMIGAFGDVMQQAGFNAARNAQDEAISASNQQNWAQNVLPALYAKANTAGKDWQGAADIMKLAAAVMSFSALAGAGGGAAAGGGDAATSTTGVLDQMGGTPAEFAGKDLFGMGKMFPAATGFTGTTATAGATAAPAATSMFSQGYEDDLLKYLNDPNLWGKPMPAYWDYYNLGK